MSPQLKTHIMNKAQLIAKLAAAGVKPSESPIDVTSFGKIATSELETFTSSKGKLYYKADKYIFATKDFSKTEVEIKLLTANIDFGKMKKGDTFVVAE